ncbi:hypothetical protein DL96DRAFT_1625197 [Flagelloscypha sp. PMI_526]|nr:hypothetical protein DL96DRAFT_1625197 [Flagelloscypha sp. PMI_526]
MGWWTAFFLAVRKDPGYSDEGNPPKSHWNLSDIPDLSGKIFLVTGANSGIGYETAKNLLNNGAKVYITARGSVKGQDTLKRLEKDTGKQAIFLDLDLSDLASVKRAAEEFKSKESQLHVLINNAGVLTPPKNQFTAQGWDLQFGTNVVGHFLLIKLLLPTLQATAQSSTPGTVRIVNVSSSAQFWATEFSFDVLKDGPARNKLSPEELYGVSKRGNVILSNELAKRYGGEGIVSTSLNPGNIATDLQRNMANVVWRTIQAKMLYPPTLGATTQLWAATSNEGKELNGKYLKPWARIGKPATDCDDPEVGKKLWQLLEDAVQEFH